VKQACEGRENTRVTYFNKDHPKNQRGFPFYAAVEDDLKKNKAKLVTLFHRIWYIITSNLEGDRFIIVDPWLDLHKHDKYSALLDGPRSRESQQLDEGLAESQGQTIAIEETEKPENPPHQSEGEEEETRSEEQEKIDQEIRLTPVTLT